MRNLIGFINRMNIFLWIVGIFAGHAALYLVLGTDTWLATTFLATAFYGAVLLVVKMVTKRYAGDKEKI